MSVVGIDVLARSRYGGRLRLIALIEQAAVIERICAISGSLMRSCPESRAGAVVPLAGAGDRPTGTRIDIDLGL